MNMRNKNDFWTITVIIIALCAMFPFVFPSIKDRTELMTRNAVRLADTYLSGSGPAAGSPGPETGADGVSGSDPDVGAAGTSAEESPADGTAPAPAADGITPQSQQPQEGDRQEDKPREDAAQNSLPDAEPTDPAPEPAAEEPAQPQFVHSDKSYFDNALFIGDSRTDDLRQFGTLDNADYYARVGMSVFNIDDKPVNVDGVGKVTLDQLLTRRGYGKVYIMLGFNEIGYNFNSIIKQYSKLIDRVKKAEPTAVIYVEANLLVSEKKSRAGDEGTNASFIELNKRLSELADGRTVFYIDVNPLFCENGALRDDMSGDGTHPYAKYYKTWSEWLCDNTVDVSTVDRSAD